MKKTYPPAFASFLLVAFLKATLGYCIGGTSAHGNDQELLDAFKDSDPNPIQQGIGVAQTKEKDTSAYTEEKKKKCEEIYRGHYVGEQTDGDVQYDDSGVPQSKTLLMRYHYKCLCSDGTTIGEDASPKGNVSIAGPIPELGGLEKPKLVRNSCDEKADVPKAPPSRSVSPYNPPTPEKERSPEKSKPPKPSDPAPQKTPSEPPPPRHSSATPAAIAPEKPTITPTPSKAHAPTIVALPPPPPKPVKAEPSQTEKRQKRCEEVGGVFTADGEKGERCRCIRSTITTSGLDDGKMTCDDSNRFQDRKKAQQEIDLACEKRGKTKSIIDSVNGEDGSWSGTCTCEYGGVAIDPKVADVSVLCPTNKFKAHYMHWFPPKGLKTTGSPPDLLPGFITAIPKWMMDRIAPNGRIFVTEGEFWNRVNAFFERVFHFKLHDYKSGWRM